ncbi:MAG: nickel pincer cofactor biosynthesis protein LarB, partial [Deltaproteobacteria bacterium]|nr:nickel pincer cofactor biosynthesis protein LarB [Deltaproteobacteria bacterium]
GKTPEHLIHIVDEWVARGKNVLATRAEPSIAAAICARIARAQYDPVSRCLAIIQQPIEPVDRRLCIVAAGTADVPVAEEARRTAAFFGVEASTLYDVGVAGIHRLLGQIETVRQADACIVVAGMEGALPSVIGGLVACPVIAVPTSVGYGTHQQGMTALFAMLNSCAEGITVVNIDNGFGGACAALRILRTIQR